ncbi:MarR family transcriptional regulator [Lachnospiraceae bacterium OttesenSCG-928-J05]|nr:MarR family transcriptional regulator [Lachnospiraceae bacterium OttesenSCG-928-J05]
MQELEKQLAKTVDNNASIQKYDARAQLTPYLAGAYEFYKVNVLGTSFLLIKGLDERMTMHTQKHIHTIEDRLGMYAAVWEERMTPYKRKKYLSERIPFIIGNNQMFLPFLGTYLDLREEKSQEEKKVKKFTPAMQIIFLRVLYGTETKWTQAELSKETGVTAMTVSRTLEIFVNMGLLEYSVEGLTGRKKIYVVKDTGDFFKEGEKYLINPVKKSFYVKSIPKKMKYFTSGLSALGENTMLSEPSYTIVAIYRKADIETLKQEEIAKEEAYEESLFEVQEMKYDISRITKDSIIDPISLICSLADMDERIEIAIEEMMERYVWYKD